MKSDLVDIEARELHRTERAILITPTGREEDKVWLPLSSVEVEPTKRAGYVVLTMTEGLAINKKLEAYI